jgi:deazaflavin-dependent oxidoreductase (nitroreductase family)
MTNDRRTVTQLLAGLPVVYATTTGRRSGEVRTHPLAAVPFRDTLAVIGSNFGAKRTLAWVFNLEADPRARVQSSTVWTAKALSLRRGQPRGLV